MLSRLFSNYLKIIKIKDRRLFSNHLKIIKMLNFILKILQSAKNHKIRRLNIFSPQNQLNNSIIYNYVFLYYLDCFQII